MIIFNAIIITICFIALMIAMAVIADLHIMFLNKWDIYKENKEVRQREKLNRKIEKYKEELKNKKEKDVK